MIRRRFLPFLPFFPFPKPLPLLDIPDPRSLRLAATREYATGWEMFPCTASLDVGRGALSGAAYNPFPARAHFSRGKKGKILLIEFCHPPLSFLHFAHSFPRRVYYNPITINSLLTLFVATGGVPLRSVQPQPGLTPFARLSVPICELPFRTSCSRRCHTEARCSARNEIRAPLFVA